MLWMRSASARTDERGIWLGNLHCLCDLANFLAYEQWLKLAFLRQPTRPANDTASTAGTASTMPGAMMEQSGTIAPPTQRDLSRTTVTSVTGNACFLGIYL